MAEQLQILQIALVDEQCAVAQQTAPMAESIWRQHQQEGQLHQPGAGRLISSSELSI